MQRMAFARRLSRRAMIARRRIAGVYRTLCDGGVEWKQLSTNKHNSLPNRTDGISPFMGRSPKYKNIRIVSEYHVHLRTSLEHLLCASMTPMFVVRHDDGVTE